ncbi:MAG: hypothetical protein ABIL06_17380 [Pseudomonadota bacterium]
MEFPIQEKTYVEIPFIKQLKGMGWDHIEGDIGVPYFSEWESFQNVLLVGRLKSALKRINPDNRGRPWTTKGRDVLQ